MFVAQLPDINNSTNVKENIINSSIVYAQKGQIIEEDSGSQRLILSDGIRYQSDAQNNEFRKAVMLKMRRIL